MLTRGGWPALKTSRMFLLSTRARVASVNRQWQSTLPTRWWTKARKSVFLTLIFMDPHCQLWSHHAAPIFTKRKTMHLKYNRSNLLASKRCHTDLPLRVSQQCWGDQWPVISSHNLWGQLNGTTSTILSLISHQEQVISSWLCCRSWRLKLQ